MSRWVRVVMILICDDYSRKEHKCYGGNRRGRDAAREGVVEEVAFGFGFERWQSLDKQREKVMYRKI